MIIIILTFSLLIYNFISITFLILIIYSSLISIVFLVNGVLVMYSLSFKYRDSFIYFGLLMNYYSFSFQLFYSYFCSLYFYLLLSIIYLDSLSTLYVCFPQSFHSQNLSMNGVGNLVFDNSMFIFIIYFFIVGMININSSMIYLFLYFILLFLIFLFNYIKFTWIDYMFFSSI